MTSEQQAHSAKRRLTGAVDRAMYSSLIEKKTRSKRAEGLP